MGFRHPLDASPSTGGQRSSAVADPNWQLFVDAMSYSNGGMFVPKYANWMEQLHMRYEQIWRDELEPRIALEQAQQIVEQELSK